SQGSDPDLARRLQAARTDLVPTLQSAENNENSSAGAVLSTVDGNGQQKERLRKPMRTSFPASRDGPLKDASSVTRYQPGGSSSATAAPAPAPGSRDPGGRTGPAGLTAGFRGDPGRADGPVGRSRGTVCDLVPPPPRGELSPRRRLGVSAGPTGRNPQGVGVIDL